MVRQRHEPARIMERSEFRAPRSWPSESEYRRYSTTWRFAPWPPGAPLLCSSSTITGTSCRSAAARTIDFGVSAKVRKYESAPSVGSPHTEPTAFSVGVLPLRERPHRYTMKVWTPTTDTRGEAKLAASTQRKAGDASRAGDTPATQPSSVPAGSRNGRAFTASSGDGSNRTTVASSSSWPPVSPAS